jgi:hypothetical protein
MQSPRHKRHAVGNNRNATRNPPCRLAERELDAQLVRLGKMGVHARSSVAAGIPEGDLTVAVKPPPRDPLVRRALAALRFRCGGRPLLARTPVKLIEGVRRAQ